MKCPNCSAKLSWKSSIFQGTTCPSCEAEISSSQSVGISAALMGLVVGKMFYAGYIWEASIIGIITLVTLIVLTPKTLKATLKNESDT